MNEPPARNAAGGAASSFNGSDMPTSGAIRTKPMSLPMLQTRTTGPIPNRFTLTPPETPISPQDSETLVPPTDPLFHNYLRAKHAFDPAFDPCTETESASITVPIKQGDLILVHSVHANGWADGTVLASGSRGWVPTNYCETYDHSYIRNLLNAMTQFWDLLEESGATSFSTFVRQDYIRGLIAGVRYLLEFSGCLHRDSRLVEQHLGIRRMRKGLLADLSSMVQKAKELQDVASQPYAGEVVHIVLDELVIKACKVVTRAVRFVDVWAQEIPATQANHDAALILGRPTASGSTKVETLVSQESSNSLLPQPLDSAKFFTSSDGFGSNPPLPSSGKSSVSTVRASFSGTSHHRLPLIRNEHRDGPSASEQLSQAHDLCISHIGKFLGHHLRPRSHTELTAITRDLESSSQSLLAIVHQISAKQTHSSESMRQSTMAVQAAVQGLLQSTEEVFSFSDNSDDDIVVLPDQVNRLVAIGTRLIRAVSESLAHARKVLEDIGDFELETPPLPWTADSQVDAVNVQDGLHRRRTSRVTLGQARRLSHKALPPTPKVLDHSTPCAIAITTFGSPSPPTSFVGSQMPPPTRLAPQIVPPTPSGRNTTGYASPLSTANSTVPPSPFKSDAVSTGRKDSVSTSIADSTSMQGSHFRDSENSVISTTSTRATTPERGASHRKGLDSKLLSSFASLSSMGSGVTDASAEMDAVLLHKTFAHELVLNSQGQVVGGSLQALVEQMTLHDATPGPQFATSFYLTFRIFTNPRDLAQAFIDRFDYIGDSKTVGKPVRLRICQFFKGWLETYWHAEADKEALGDVRYFAWHKLKAHLPSAAERLLELTRKVTAAYQSGTAGAPLVSGIGKTTTSMINASHTEAPIPDPVITKSQLNMLRNATSKPTDANILDLDPIELARQITLIVSKRYNDIHPDELLTLEWNKKSSTRGVNLRSVSSISTELAHVVGDTVLSPTEAKKRALVIKHWIKVAAALQDQHNYESLMAVVASLDSSMLQRLKRTWELVSKKTKIRFAELKTIIDVSQNYASLRRQVDDAQAPCIPFMGIYLQDMTFIDAGNLATRQIPRSSPGGSATEAATVVINFDKYARMARIVTQIQRFQTPYPLRAVPELQIWLEAYMDHMGDATDALVGSFHRRSLILEPRQDDLLRPKTMEANNRRLTTHGSTQTNDERPKTSRAITERFKSGQDDMAPPMPAGKDFSRIDLFWKSTPFAFRGGFGGHPDLPVETAAGAGK
ncbi:Ras guanine nucleotide exchange factor bud5 [Oleoguttula sp. CCFEE 5521]